DPRGLGVLIHELGDGRAQLRRVHFEADDDLVDRRLAVLPPPLHFVVVARQPDRLCQGLVVVGFHVEQVRRSPFQRLAHGGPPCPNRRRPSAGIAETTPRIFRLDNRRIRTTYSGPGFTTTRGGSRA